MKNKVFALSVPLLAMVILSVGAAGSSDNAGSSGDKPREVIIGAGSAMNPYWYLDENNQLTGFEKAVLDEIDARHPEFTLSYQIYDFPNILLSLDAGKIDVAVHQYEYNIERDQKYLYGKEGYTTFPLHLVVREDDFSINGLEDLKGKNFVSTTTTGNDYYVANKWNEDHGRPFTIIFAATNALALEDIASGRADAMFGMIRNLEAYKKEYNAKIRIAGDKPVVNSNAYYLFNRKTGEELRQAFDATLRELKDDGTLVQLSRKWLGDDYIAKD